MTINLSYILYTTFLQSLHYKRRVCEMLSVVTVLSPTIVQCFFDREFLISLSRDHLYRGTPSGPQTPRYIGILLYSKNNVLKSGNSENGHFKMK